MRKTSIFGHFGPKWPILDSFWPKWAKREFLKALGTFFSRLQALTNCKVSEKEINGFRANARTYAQTNGHKSLGLQQLRRETKKKLEIFEFVYKPMGWSYNAG